MRFSEVGSREINIALATHADANEIALLSRDLVENGLRWRYTPSRISKLIVKHSTNVAAAKKNDVLVGFGIMRYHDNLANLDLLGVKPVYHRQGIGKSLVAWLELVALTAGIQWVYVQAREENKQALDFYKELGYRRRSIRIGTYDGLYNSVRMVKNLYSKSGQTSDLDV